MPDFELEKLYSGPIAGIDEVGRGPWAGPVVAAAVILDQTRNINNILGLVQDSKKLTPEKRQNICQKLIASGACFYAIGQASVEEIDRLNIREATFLAMQRAVAGLSITPKVALIDGNACPNLPCESYSVIKGDDVSYSIAAASIIAKEYRDDLMRAYGESHPGYGFENHMGYGTQQHQNALATLGVLPIHRKSFKPIQERLKISG
jgi:ribonuclease HII